MPRRHQTARRTLLTATIATLVAATTPVAPVLAADPVEVSFVPTGVQQQWVVPAGVTSIHVVLIGGRGANASSTVGRGHVVTGDVEVTPGATLYVTVGGDGALPSGGLPGAGGFNGGGSGGRGSADSGAGGGGASDIRTVPRTSAGSLDSRLLVAAGGGGRGAGAVAGGGTGFPGGAGGAAGTAGEVGPNLTGTTGAAGGAGTATAGGPGGANGPGTQDGGSGGTGTSGAGGDGGGSTTVNTYGGGGGGGGYYGGGGGGAGQSGSGAGGGGGSSFTGTASNASVAPNTTSNGASVVITYVPGETPPDPTQGPDTGVVDATITMSESSVCIELSTATVDFGSGRFGQVGVSGTPEIEVTNCGVGQQTIFARATDATAPGASWDLVKDTTTCEDGTLGTDAFHLQLHENQTPDVDWLLGTSNTELETIAEGSFGSFGPSIDTACPGSSGAGQQMSMQIIFTATEAAP